MTKDYAKEYSNDFVELDARYLGVKGYVEKMSLGKIRSLIINGPSGVGKTYSVENYLRTYAKGNYKMSDVSVCETNRVT